MSQMEIEEQKPTNQNNFNCNKNAKKKKKKKWKIQNVIIPTATMKRVLLYFVSLWERPENK